ncbi:MAG: Glu/Leu/Phe/Val family dehydrogenase [Hyphomicrobiales bacterium]
MAIFDVPDFDGHEVVDAFHDKETGLKGFIALHSTARGPGFGGCRMWNYASEEDAITDALRLSRGMSYKNALAGLSYGGGKAVIMGDPRTGKSRELFEAFGRAVDRLGGSYVTAEDVGVGVEDMMAVARTTKFVSGITRKTKGFRGGDPSPRTARGVFEGLRAAVRFSLERDVEGLTVAVQGLGSVGYNLASLLHAAGAKLVVADISKEAVERVAEIYGAKIVAPEDILTYEADVLAPCAMGAVLNKKTIPQLGAKVVAGAANNQLATVADGELLMESGIIYAPDYVINAGGIIAVTAEYEGTATEADVQKRILEIGPRTLDLLQEAKNKNRPAGEIADERARQLIGRSNDKQTAAA